MNFADSCLFPVVSSDIEDRILEFMVQTDRGWECTKCQYSTFNRKGLMNHIESKHVNIGGVSCPHCPKVCPTSCPQGCPPSCPPSCLQSCLQSCLSQKLFKNLSKKLSQKVVAKFVLKVVQKIAKKNLKAVPKIVS